MDNKVKCACGNHIATLTNKCVVMRHRGRTLRIYGKVVICCEKCGGITKAEPGLRRLGGDKSDMSTGKASNG